MIETTLKRFRALIVNYTSAAATWISLTVLIARFRELEEDLLQHLYLENNILIPKAINIEKGLLGGL